MKAILAVDPGKNGSLVRVEWDEDGKVGTYTCLDLPDLGDPSVNSIEWVDNLLGMGCGLDVRQVFIEDVHCRPGNGVSRNESFAYGIGRLHTCLEYLSGCEVNDVEFVFVRPQVWMSDLGCMTGGDKNVTKRKAQDLFLFPNYKITHRNADALLIAYWAKEVYLK